MSVLKSTFLFIFFYTLVIPCKSQEKNRFIVGIIRDGNSNAPIPYANIYLKSDKYAGTVSNTDGRFKLLVAATLNKDSLLISFVGYKTTKIYIEESTFSQSMSIFLTELPVVLKDIQVLGTTPFTFLKLAAKKTTEKSISPTILNCYYREFISKNGRFTKFADALVDYFVEIREEKNPYVQVRVMESRAKYVPVVIETKSMGDINIPQQVDIEMLPSFLDAQIRLNNIVQNGDDYNFDLYEVSDSVGNEFYKVSFAPKQEIKKQLLEGIFFIDKSSSVIRSVQYNLPDSHKPYSKIFKLPFGMRNQLTAATVYIQYHMIGEKCQLKYVKLSVSVHVFDKKDFDVTHVFSNEMLVNDFEEGNIKKFESNELWRKKSIYKRGNNYKSKFWEGKRGLLATEEEQKIIESLSSNNSSN